MRYGIGNCYVFEIFAAVKRFVCDTDRAGFDRLRTHHARADLNQMLS